MASKKAKKNVIDRKKQRQQLKPETLEPLTTENSVDEIIEGLDSSDSGRIIFRVVPKASGQQR